MTETVRAYPTVTSDVRYVCNLVSRAGLAGVVIYIFWKGIMHYHYWFSWHIFLCTIGYVPIMVESILLFAGDDTWVQFFSTRTRYIIHGVIITIGIACFTAGNLTIYYYTNKEHFNSLHGITGGISMVLCLLSLIIGLGTYYSQKLKNFITPVKLKFIHNIIGILGYIIGMISLCYAFYTGWWVFYTTEISRKAVLIVTIICTLCTLNGSICSAYRQIKSM